MPVVLLLVGCEGAIGDGDGPIGPGDGGMDQAGIDGDAGPCTEDQRSLEIRVGDYLQTTCAHAGCHGPVGTRRPSFAAADLERLVGSGRIVPFAPTEGAVMGRLTSDDPTLAMPPTIAHPGEENLQLMRDWINAGARTGCVEPRPRPEPHPNSLDQDELFTAEGETFFGPRSYRLGSPEFIHAFGGHLSMDSLQANPLSSSGFFSTYGVDQLMDGQTLGLYLDTLVSSRTGRGRSEWWDTSRFPGLPDMRCITRDGNPAEVDDACRDEFVQRLLEDYAYLRASTEEERALLRGVLDEELLREDGGSRRSTLRIVAETAFLFSGAMFRRIGTEGLLDEDAFANLLSLALTTHPSSGRRNGYEARRELSWLAAYRAAVASEGASIDLYRRTVAEALTLGVAGGEFDLDDQDRPDLGIDLTWNNPALIRMRRGRYWLAPRLAGFFREYFGYAGVANIAKDEPWATSEWDLHRPGEGPSNHVSRSGDPEVDRGRFYGDLFLTNGYDRAREGGGSEPGFVAQLDDAIARMVVEAERSGGDVFEALFSSTTYRTPAVPGNSANPEPMFSDPVPARRPEDPGRNESRNYVSGNACEPDFCRTNEARDTRFADRCCGFNQLTDDGEVVARRGPCIPNGIEGGAMTGICSVGGISNSRYGWQAASFVYGRDRRTVEMRFDEGRYNNAAARGDLNDQLRADASHEGRWIDLPTAERAGVLTHPAWLSAYGGNAENDASAVLRGHWIREHLFCESVGGLDLVSLSAQLAENTDELSARDRLHATFYSEEAEPRCANAACHGAMNDLGLPFEIYNHAGFLRAEDHGAPVDGSATITNWPGRRDAVAVESAIELLGLIVDDSHARRCFLRHVFRYFVGRNETMEDRNVLAAMGEAFERRGSLLQALEAL
ncbi:MAG: DUF1588 domain-containing protein, partial [Myxococcota bacterium]